MARITAHDKAVIDLNAQNILGRDIAVNIGEDYVFEVPRYRTIPMKEGINIRVTYKESECKVNKLLGWIKRKNPFSDKRNRSRCCFQDFCSAKKLSH